MQKGFSDKLPIIPVIIFLLLNLLFAQQMDWAVATDSAEWRARGLHTSVVFDNKMWVIGGFNSTRQNDVWYSEDGSIWTLATASAPWAGRFSHTSVVFDNKMWVIGGFTGSLKNDVWFSEDGINWTQATSSANWSARCYFTSVVFDNKIWIFGGYNGNNLNDVWYSEDGVYWICTTDSAEWRPRYDHTSLVFDNKMWILGGFDYCDEMSDVWYSEDGTNWTRAIGNMPSRYGHSSIIFDNKMWVIGGNSYGHDDVWFSTSGESWIRAIDNAPWSGRGYHTSVVYNDKIWVIGGIDYYGRRNDVWYSRGFTDLLFPNGGETLEGGHHYIIHWHSIGHGFDSNRLLLSINGGYTYDDTIAQDIAPTETTYLWRAHRLNRTTCRVKVQALDTGNIVIREDKSESNFTIMTEVHIMWPNWRESLPGGSNQTVRWFTYGSGFSRFRLLFSRNGGRTYPDTLAHNLPPSQTTYSWIVPSINSATCQIKVQVIDTTNTVVIEDESDEYFVIYTPIWLASSQYPMFHYNQQHTGRSPYNGSTTSQVRWFYSTSQPIISSPIISPDSTIYFISENDTLYAIRLDGTKRWQYYLEQGTQLTPAIANDNTIYVGNGLGYFKCLPHNLSEIYWQYRTGFPILSSPVVSNNGFIYVGSDNGYLYSFNPDGRLRWSYNIGSPIHSSPAIAQNQTIYVSSNQNKLIAINPAGTRIWDMILPAAILASPLIGIDGTIYLGCCNGKMYAIDRFGVVKWNYQTADSITSSAAIDSTGIIYFGSYDGYVYALEDAGNQANLIWRYQTQGKVRSSPSISANGIIYIGSDDGYIYAISTNGSLAWTRMTGNAVRSSPAIGAEGTIYIGSDDGRLYAIGYVPSVEEEVVNLDVPKSFKLYSGQPNPFATITNIRFGLPRTSSVVLKIYSSSGLILKDLVADTKNPGYHTVTWDGTDYTGKKVPAGIYFCCLETGNIKEVKKIIKVD